MFCQALLALARGGERRVRMSLEGREEPLGVERRHTARAGAVTACRYK